MKSRNSCLHRVHFATPPPSPQASSDPGSVIFHLPQTGSYSLMTVSSRVQPEIISPQPRHTRVWVCPSVGTSLAPNQQSATRFYSGRRLFPVNTTLSAIFKFPLPLLRILLHAVFTKDPIFLIPAGCVVSIPSDSFV